MAVKLIKSQNAPAPIGPYSQAVEVNGFIFTSGQIALTANGELIQEDITAQSKQVFDNLSEVLNAAGSDLDHVVKTTIYLKNMSDFGKVNEIYANYFGKSLPARSTVEVSRLPKDVLVEVDCIAIKK